MSISSKKDDLFSITETGGDQMQPAVAVAKKPARDSKIDYYRKYAIHSGNTYMPISSTVSTLPAGYYKVGINDASIPLFIKQSYNIADLIRFPNTVVDRVINEFDAFWQKKEQYLKMGEPHRRGFLLWGPPGGGKTCAVSLIADSFIRSGNVVFNFSRVFDTAIPIFRLLEPERKLMIIIEDIDMLIEDGGDRVERDLLQLLDGDIQLTNTVIIATTNYIERLPDRISNRPSRFDRIELVGMPSATEREMYLKQKSKKLTDSEISKWVKDTEDYTFAHLKELIVAVEVFESDYQETLNRLNKMREKKDTSDDYERQMRGKGKQRFGFNTKDDESVIDEPEDEGSARYGDV